MTPARILQTIGRQLFGYDVFISYAHRDGTLYASHLAEKLTARGYSCFFDRFASIGTDLAAQTLRALRSCRTLVVIGSPAAGSSSVVTAEIREFLDSNKQRSPLIVIAFDEAVRKAAWWQLVAGVPISRESEHDLRQGMPSTEVIDRIDATFRFLSRNRRLRQVALTVTSIVAISVLLNLYFVFLRPWHPDIAPLSTSNASPWVLAATSFIVGIASASLWQRFTGRRRSAEAKSVAHQVEQAGEAAFLKPFISHSDKDEIFARRLESALDRRGVRCWLAYKRLQGGNDIHKVVSKAIEDSDKFLLCCSVDAFQSWWVDKEIGGAFQKEERLSKGKKKEVEIVIPLDLDGTLMKDIWENGYKTLLLRKKAVDFRGWRSQEKFEAQVNELMMALRPISEDTENDSYGS